MSNAIKTICKVSKEVWGNPLGRSLTIAGYTAVISVITVAIQAVGFQLGLDSRVVALEGDSAQYVLVSNDILKRLDILESKLDLLISLR